MIASIFTIFKAIWCVGVCLRVLATIMSSYHSGTILVDSLDISLTLVIIILLSMLIIVNYGHWCMEPLEALGSYLCS